MQIFLKYKNDKKIVFLTNFIETKMLSQSKFMRLISHVGAKKFCGDTGVNQGLVKFSKAIF